jgi:butyryl-CoA dehydrogenase
MDYGLTEMQVEIRDLAKRIADEQIRPVSAKYDQSGEFPWPIVKILADAGLCGVYIGEEYGGMGGGVLDLVIVVEELSKACAGIALSLAATALGTFPIILHGSPEQKKKYLPDIASGKKLAAFAITEPEAGSDAGGIKTVAVKDGDYYVINGKKQWITNGGEAETYSVITLTDKSKGPRGATAFILEKGMPGFNFGKKEDKLGIRASATRELIFEDCRVHKSQMLGKEGRGFLVAMDTFDNSRPGVAAQAVGIAAGALDLAVDYARGRKQFGKAVASFQGLQFMLADMATAVEASRALTYAASRAIDKGDKNVGAASAMAKLFASDTAMKVSTDALQIFGGYGYMREYPIEKYMRDAKITQIYEGTNQIQREVIALDLIRQSAKKGK